MEKILVSECLLGRPVRYDGKSKAVDHTLLKQWKNEGRLVIICPEVSGGLSIPRDPAEIQHDGRVITITDTNVTNEFTRGARVALNLCQQHNIKFAILKESSPSCGSNFVYSGKFNGEKRQGKGITSQLLEKQGVRVFSENEIDELAELLSG